MGLLDEKDWVSDWIAYVPGKPGRIIYFKGTFCQQKEVEKARLYISGLGYYEMYINNRKVGDHVLDPAQSSYDKRVYYASYDVKRLPVAGERAAGSRRPGLVRDAEAADADGNRLHGRQRNER